MNEYTSFIMQVMPKHDKQLRAVTFESKVRKLEDKKDLIPIIDGSNKNILSGERDVENTFSSNYMPATIGSCASNKYRIPLQTPSFAQRTSALTNSSYSGFEFYRGYTAERWPELAVTIKHFDSVTTSRNGNRGRTTYSDDQVAELENTFAVNPYPTPQARQNLARNINVPEGKIKIWFQNRRAREKKQRLNYSNWKSSVKSMPDQNTASILHRRNKPHRSCNNNNNNKPLVENISSSSYQWNWSRSNFSDIPPSSSISLSCLSLDVPETPVYDTNFKQYPQQQQQQQPNDNIFTKNKLFKTNDNKKQFNHCEKQSGENGSYRVATAIPQVNQSDLIPDRFPVITSTHSLKANPPYIKKTNPALHSFNNTLNANNQTSSNIKLPFDFQAKCSIDSEAIFMQSLFYDSQNDMQHDLTYHNETTHNGINLATGSNLKGSLARENYICLSSEFLSSPPPIRRFVCPFKNLFDNVKNVNDFCQRSQDLEVSRKPGFDQVNSVASNLQNNLFGHFNNLPTGYNPKQYATERTGEFNYQPSPKTQNLQTLKGRFKQTQMDESAMEVSSSIFGYYPEPRLQQLTVFANHQEQNTYCKTGGNILPSYTSAVSMENRTTLNCNDNITSTWSVANQTNENINIKHLQS